MNYLICIICIMPHVLFAGIIKDPERKSGSRGTVALAWELDETTTTTIQASIIESTGAVSDSVTLSDPKMKSNHAMIAINDALGMSDAQIAVTWISYNSAKNVHILYAAMLQPSFGKSNSIKVLGVSKVSDIQTEDVLKNMDITIDAQGNLIANWLSSDKATGQNQLQSAHATFGQKKWSISPVAN